LIFKLYEKQGGLQNDPFEMTLIRETKNFDTFTKESSIRESTTFSNHPYCSRKQS